jgi:hypothetical protein
LRPKAADNFWIAQKISVHIETLQFMARSANVRAFLFFLKPRAHQTTALRRTSINKVRLSELEQYKQHVFDFRH